MNSRELQDNIINITRNTRIQKIQGNKISELQDNDTAKLQDNEIKYISRPY